MTPDEINARCYVDVKANKEVFESLTKNLKVTYDGYRFSYKVMQLFWEAVESWGSSSLVTVNLMIIIMVEKGLPIVLMRVAY